MRSKILAILALALITGAAGAGDKLNTTFFGNKAVEGYDTVAYFTQGKAVKGDKRFRVEYGGANWHFASAEHKALFEAAPERYAPQFGGYCAYAVAEKHDLVGIDPRVFSIVDGKLYLNYSNKVRDRWNAKQAEYITEGHRIWPEIGQK